MRVLPLAHARRHELGVLLIGGDWACAHGDLAGLVDVARRLGEPTMGAARTHALEVAPLCLLDHEHERAIRKWVWLRAQLQHGMTARTGAT